jgi:hypothetical protein
MLIIGVNIPKYQSQPISNHGRVRRSAHATTERPASSAPASATSHGGRPLCG